MLTWATCDALGEIAWGWKKQALAAAKPIGANVVRCDMGPLSGSAWIVLLGVRGTGASELDLVACDGRQIPVYVESRLVLPCLIGLRGGTPKPKWEEKWRLVTVEICNRRLGRLGGINGPSPTP